MKHRLRAFALGLAAALGTTTAHAQPTDAGSPAGTRDPVVASRAIQDQQSERSFVDKARDWADDTKIIERLQGDVDGWYPRFGGMTRGSGFAVGPGYRFHLFDQKVFVDLSAGLSTRLYKVVDARVRWINVGDERLEVWTDYRFEDYPQEDFFGMGADSPADARTNYGFRSSDVTTRLHAKLQPWLHAGAEVGYTHPRIGRGSDREWPSTEEIFADGDAPGLAAQPNYLHASVFSEIDYRDAPGNPTAGGFYRASFGVWDDRTLEQYNFRRFDGNVAQHIPLTEERRHVVSGRVGVSLVNNTDGNRVPFYYLPYVGGTDTVRSYREFRFKDENALWFGAEYRWIPMPWVSGALFADFGKVAADWQDIRPTNLKQGYGFGFRVHSSKQTFLRMDFGFGGGEGWRTFFKIGI